MIISQKQKIKITWIKKKRSHAWQSPSQPRDTVGRGYLPQLVLAWEVLPFLWAPECLLTQRHWMAISMSKGDPATIGTEPRKSSPAPWAWDTMQRSLEKLFIRIPQATPPSWTTGSPHGMRQIKQSRVEPQRLWKLNLSLELQPTKSMPGPACYTWNRMTAC